MAPRLKCSIFFFHLPTPPLPFSISAERVTSFPCLRLQRCNLERPAGRWRADNELSALQLKWKIEKVSKKGCEDEVRARPLLQLLGQHSAAVKALRDPGVSPCVGSAPRSTTVIVSLFAQAKRDFYCDKWCVQRSQKHPQISSLRVLIICALAESWVCVCVCG